MVSSVKLLIIKKDKYILWTMKKEQYLAHTDYALWEVILNGTSAVQMTKDKAGNEIEVPPITAQQILARTRERKAKSTLLMAILDEHLARFQGIKDAKTLWAAIITRFGEGLDKGYDRFQRLLSLLEIHEAGASTEDANKKFLRYLPSTWSNISLIMRNKPCIDNLDIDDLYNNLKVYEADIKGSSGLFSNSQNAIALRHKLDNEDLDQINQDDLEEMDLKWLIILTVIEEGTLLEIADQQGIQGTGVEMLGMQEEEATDFALMAFTSNPSSSSSSNSELDEALREKEDLKAKLKKFETSSKNLTKLLDSQISAKVKTGLGYDSQFNKKEVLDIKEEEVTETVFENCLSDEENSLANDRFKKGKRYCNTPKNACRIGILYGGVTS
nr:ribonuclease H-like domain-containing protein [Tanacetum cinerariifolium]